MSDVVTATIDLDVRQARELTDRIRTTLQLGHHLIQEAYAGRAWDALGYDSWDAYCAGEFNEARMVRLPVEQRREIVAEMTEAGMSTRAIASGLGVSVGTVHSDANAGVQNRTPATTTTGVDGKTYSRPSPTPAAPATSSLDQFESALSESPEAGPATPAPGAPLAERRKPLTDKAARSAEQFMQSAMDLQGLVGDDRFRGNRDSLTSLTLTRLLAGLEATASYLTSLAVAPEVTEDERSRWSTSLTATSRALAALAAPIAKES